MYKTFDQQYGFERGDQGRSFFQHTTAMVLMVYDTTTKPSLQYLEDVYSNLPLPPTRGRREATIARNEDGSEYIVPPVRAIRVGISDDAPRYPAQRYPVIIAGYKPDAQVFQEVNLADVEKFIQDRPECKFGGEFALHNQEEIDAVFLACIEALHRLKEQGVASLRKVNVWMRSKIIPI
jgi:hypothetical protein